MGAALVCRIRAIYDRARVGVIQSSNTPFHHRAYIRIYYMSLLRHNNVVFKLLLYPHVLLCINKKYYEHTRKKGRHFTILIHCSHGHYICISSII